VEWEGGARSRPAIALIEYEMMVDPVSSTNDGEGGDDGNKEIENDSKWEGDILHSGKGPGHGVV